MNGDICKIEGCDKPARSRGWCNNHYAKWHRTGNPLGSDALGRQARKRATTEKRCRICGEVKTREHFYVNATGHLGSYCKPCHNERVRQDHRRRREAKPKKPKRSDSPCDFEGCHNSAYVTIDGYEGWYCRSHWQQDRAGKPLTPLRPIKKSYINDDVRRCTGCEEIKPMGAFHTRSNGTSQQRCKVCMSLISRYGTLMREGRLQDALEHVQGMPEALRELYLGKYLERIN